MSRTERTQVNADRSLRSRDADQRRFKHKELTDRIIGIFFDVYNELGWGFLESVYERAMIVALGEAGIRAESQLPVDVWFRGERIHPFRLDLVAERAIVIELKAARSWDESFEKKLLNYLRATEFEVGLVLNFGPKPELKRLAFDNDRKIRVDPRFASEASDPRLSASESGDQPPWDIEEIAAAEEPRVAD